MHPRAQSFDKEKYVLCRHPPQHLLLHAGRILYYSILFVALALVIELLSRAYYYQQLSSSPSAAVQVVNDFHRVIINRLTSDTQANAACQRAPSGTISIIFPMPSKLHSQRFGYIYPLIKKAGQLPWLFFSTGCPPSPFDLWNFLHLPSNKQNNLFMAEINTPAGHTPKRGGRRSKKLSTRIDMTPMVDLGFLLITFFVFATTMSQPHVTKLIMPADGPATKLGENAALTLVPLTGNKIFYYHGDLDAALREGSYGTTGYGPNGGIGDIIREKQIAMDHSYKGGRKELMLLIKPSAEASYGNVISLLDETRINLVDRYALVELSKAELNAAKNGKIL